jgi:hypothetical protein
MEIENLENLENNPYYYIKNSFINEVKGYKSVVDYKKLYEELSNDVKSDIDLETKRIYDIFSTSNTCPINASFYFDNARNISDIQIDIEMYYMRYSHNNCEYIKIGFNIYLKNSISYIMQCMSFYRNRNINENIAMNYINNLLFYIYIFVNEFKFDSLFDHFYHKDDLELMKDMRLRSLRLFGNLDSECCVCTEKSITTTTCNHILCNKCFSKLPVKICPMCRGNLDSEEQNYSNLNFFVEHIPSLLTSSSILTNS